MAGAPGAAAAGLQLRVAQQLVQEVEGRWHSEFKAQGCQQHSLHLDEVVSSVGVVRDLHKVL